MQEPVENRERRNHVVSPEEGRDGFGTKNDVDTQRLEWIKVVGRIEGDSRMNGGSITEDFGIVNF